eukprot:3262231-Amphidinium_carterae.1
MRHWRQLGLITQYSVLGHNRTHNGPSALEWVLGYHNAQCSLSESHIPQLVRGSLRAEQFDDSSQQVLGGRWYNQATIRHGRQWRGAQPQSGNGATPQLSPLAQKQYNGLDESANGNSHQECGQWNKVGVDKPRDNLAPLGDNDVGERWEVAHNLLYNEYTTFDNDFVLTSLHNAALPNLSNVRG